MTTEFHLDQLPIHCVTSGWGEPKWGASINGNPLTINGTRYSAGLGTHAPSELLLSLDGNAQEFHAWVGVDDEMRAEGNGSVEFVVHGDGVPLWRSGIMRIGDAAKEVRVPLTGVRSLLLVVTDGGDDVDNDHADWANATLTIAGAPPEAVWKEESDVLAALASLRACQRGQRAMDNEAVASAVKTIERSFHKAAKLDLGSRLRGILDTLADSGDLPADMRQGQDQASVPDAKPGDPIITNERPLDRIASTWQCVRAVRMQAGQVRVPASVTTFPGTVDGSLPRVTRCVPVDVHVPFWHGTGLYAAPGEIVTVRIPASATHLGLKLQIGCFTDELWRKDRMTRAPEISRTTPLDHEETTSANGFGGMVYIVVPAKFQGKMIDIPDAWETGSFQWVTPLAPTSTVISVEIANAVEAPRYVRGQTDAQDWIRSVRGKGVPVAEIEGRNIIWTVPTALVTGLGDPEPVCEFWDDVMDHMADLAAWPRERTAPFRFVLDREISVGSGHSGYPLMAYENWSGVFDVAAVRKTGSWGAFHEIGHNHQWAYAWNFQGQDEVSVNIFTLYAHEKFCGWSIKIREIPTPEQEFTSYSASTRCKPSADGVLGAIVV